MKWKRKPSDGWMRWFALWPTRIGDDVIWLGWFWAKFHGEYDIFSLEDPRQT